MVCKGVYITWTCYPDVTPLTILGVDDVPAAEALQESFKEAVDSLPKGKLRKALRADFDAHLDTLHR